MVKANNNQLTKAIKQTNNQSNQANKATKQTNMDTLTTLDAINIKFSALENYVDSLSTRTHKKIQALEAKNETQLAIISRLHNSRIDHEEKIQALEAKTAELEQNLETVKQDLESVEADLDNRVTELEQ